MLEEIANLFLQTYSGHGNDVNEQILRAEQHLNKYGGSPQFCSCIFQIIQADQIDDQIKNAAIIYLTNMISHHWQQQEIPSESKSIIIEFLPVALLHMQQKLYPVLNKLTSVVVCNTFGTGEWPNFNEIISSGFTTNDQRFLISLIMSKAVSTLFKNVSDDKYPLYEQISNQLLASMTQFISTSCSLFQVSLCFSIAKNFSKCQFPPFFKANLSALQIWFARVRQVADVIEDPDFMSFALSSIKFVSVFFYKYVKELTELPPDDVIEVMNSVIAFSCSAPPTKVLGRCAHFIKLSFNNEITWPSIAVDFMEFTKCVILPFFVLVPSDIDDAMNDPALFINNFHAHCLDCSDPRCVMSRALSMRANNCSEFRETFTSVLLSILPCRTIEYDQITYSVCYLFSTVSRFIDPSICAQIAPLLQSGSFIVRCGALLALRDMKKAPPEIILAAFALLQDQYLIVRYYAAVALHSFLSSVDEKSADLLREQCAPHVQGIVNTYFQLTQEFNDFEFIELIKEYINFFGPILIEMAPSFVANIFQTFLNCAHLESQGNIIQSSLTQFLYLLATNSQVELISNIIIYLINEIFKTLTTAAHNLPLCAVKSLLELISNIVVISPLITGLHWQIFQILPPLTKPTILDEVCTVYINIIVRDPETARKPEIANNLISLACSLLAQLQGDIRETGPVMTFLASLLEVIASGSVLSNEEASQLYQQILPFVLNGFSIGRIVKNSTSLFGSLIIFEPNRLFQFLGENRSQVLFKWIELLGRKSCSILLRVLNKAHAALAQEELAQMLQKAILLLSEATIQENLFNEDTEDDFGLAHYNNLQQDSFFVEAPPFAKSLSVQSEAQTLSDFSNLLAAISNSNSALFQHLQSQFQVPISKIISDVMSQICI